MHNNSIVAYVTISPSLGRNNNNTTREVEEWKKIAAHTINSNNNTNIELSTAEKRSMQRQKGLLLVFYYFFFVHHSTSTAVMVCCWCYFSRPMDILARWLWRNVTYLFYISHHNSNDIWASDFCIVFFSFSHTMNDWSPLEIDRWTHWNLLFDLFWIVIFLLSLYWCLGNHYQIAI